MSRIWKVYEARFRGRLQQLGAQRLEEGVARVLAQAQRLSACERITFTQALVRLDTKLRRAERSLHCGRNPADSANVRFLCDAGLGGLARWLRAAGYEALWEANIDDSRLLREADRLGATVLTTDSLLLDRRVVRKGQVRMFWMPPTLTVPEQLEQVFLEFGLTVREPPRCMRCGGELQPVAKEAERDRIPPRTWRWLDEYFVCSQCSQLFWRGTHWQRIRAQLSAVACQPEGAGPASSTRPPTGGAKPVQARQNEASVRT